jgi:hypothetical protein
MGTLEMKLQGIPPTSGVSDVRESIKSRFPALVLCAFLMEFSSFSRAIAAETLAMTA